VDIGNGASVAALVRLTAHKSVRDAVIAGLSRLDPSHVPGVAAGLDSPQMEVRRAVVGALSRLKHPSASRALVGALLDRQPPVRAAAALALGRLGSRVAEKDLAVLANTDPDIGVQEAARSALARQEP